MTPEEFERIRARSQLAQARGDLLSRAEADRVDLINEVDRLTGVLESAWRDRDLFAELLRQATGRAD